MTETAQSRTGAPIRLTDERWAHVVDEHWELSGLRGEVLETISDAEYVVAGRYNELLAVRMVDSRRALVVVYRETSATDGFVITAFVTTRTSNLRRREQLVVPEKSSWYRYLLYEMRRNGGYTLQETQGVWVKTLQNRNGFHAPKTAESRRV